MISNIINQYNKEKSFINTNILAIIFFIIFGYFVAVSLFGLSIYTVFVLNAIIIASYELAKAFHIAKGRDFDLLGDNFKHPLMLEQVVCSSSNDEDINRKVSFFKSLDDKELNDLNKHLNKKLVFRFFMEIICVSLSSSLIYYLITSA